MRSAVVFFKENNKEEVINFLNANFTDQQNPWIVFGEDKKENPILYIGSPRDYTLEKDSFDEEESEILIKKLGNIPLLTLSVDISGKHDGTSELKEFLTKLLSQFEGVVMDDFTHYPWSLEEVQSNKIIENHLFFDYIGWNKDKI